MQITMSVITTEAEEEEETEEEVEEEGDGGGRVYNIQQTFMKIILKCTSI